LPERVAAAAVLACVAPFDGDGLDFYAGMGEQNIAEFRAAVEGEEPLRAVIGPQGIELLASTANELVEVPGVDARLASDDGHMTLAQRRIPAVHSWLRNQL
jgi:hypothetical protein